MWLPFPLSLPADTFGEVGINRYLDVTVSRNARSSDENILESSYRASTAPNLLQIYFESKIAKQNFFETKPKLVLSPLSLYFLLANKQARKARRCDSITPETITHSLAGVTARRCYRI